MHALSEDTLEILKIIPIFPSEITITEIRKKTGIRKPVIMKTILGFQSDYPICESDSHGFSYITPAQRKIFLNRINKQKIRSRESCSKEDNK